MTPSPRRPASRALRSVAGALRGGAGVAGRAAVTAARTGTDVVRRRQHIPAGSARPRGHVFVGQVWAGGQTEPFDGLVIVDAAGRIVRCGPTRAIEIPADLPVIGGPGSWIGPGIIDAHVHLGFGGLNDSLALGVVAVRDLGAPAADAWAWRTGHRRPPPGRPSIAVAGPILTAPDGYPTRSWGAEGYARFVASPSGARATVQALAADGADVIKIAVEPGSGWAVPSPAVVSAVVDATHDCGLAVVAHALSTAMVGRALDAGVDELAHTPTERLDDQLIARMVQAGVSVTSTLQTFFSDGDGPPAALNAADLVAAGVVLRYGTDLGNAGTHPGVDPRELDRLADTGLGRLGALRAATVAAASAAGVRGRSGLRRVGEDAALVVLSSDPLAEPGAWRAPTAVYCDGRLVSSRT